MLYLDWYLQAVRCILDNMVKTVVTSAVSEGMLQRLVVAAVEGGQVLESAGCGISDLVRSTVHRVCTQTLARRDAWLRLMPQDCPRDVKVDLRLSDMNGSQLFANDLLECAKEALQKARANSMQSEVLVIHADDQLSFSEEGEGQEVPRCCSLVDQRQQSRHPRDTVDKENNVDIGDDDGRQRRRSRRRRRRKRGRRRNRKFNR